MKYTHRVKIEWKSKDSIKQMLMFQGLRKSLEKMKRKNDFIYTMILEKERILIDILCFEKLANEQKNTRLGKKIGVNVLSIEKLSQ